MNETFWDLLHNAAHWEFEIFLMIIFDGLILGALFPFLRKHYLHHTTRDRRDQVYNWSMSPDTKEKPHTHHYASEEEYPSYERR